MRQGQLASPIKDYELRQLDKNVTIINIGHWFQYLDKEGRLKEVVTRDTGECLRFRGY